MSQSPSLIVDHLTVRYGREVIVSNFNLSANVGSLVWITGENGVGKSSIIRALVQGPAKGVIEFRPQFHRSAVTYYAPPMGLPLNANLTTWLQLSRRVSEGQDLVLQEDDPLVPRLSNKARLSRLSTGEAKRLLLFMLLQTQRPFTFLDEPYEHLSPTSKSRLTEILVERANRGVVVVATNQDVPALPHKTVIEIQ